MSIRYDGVEIPNFITITNVKTQVLPNIENKLLQAPRAIGAIDVGTNYGTKVITVSFIFRDNSLGFIEKSEALAEWLRVDDLKARKLVLPSHPNSYYLAKPNNSVELDDNITIAKGEIEFICLNPYRIDSNQTLINKDMSNLRSSNEIKFNYIGSAKAFPQIVLDVEGNCNSLKINFKNNIYDNYINLVGEFKAGDVVCVDLDRSKVYKNNNLDMSIWALDSRPHMLTKGLNAYRLEGNATLSIKYFNKYL